MENYHWDYFKRSIFIDADVDAVFDAWTIPAQIETWFLEKADYVDANGIARDKSKRYEVGDSYSWKWWNYEGIEKGRVVEVDAENRSMEMLFAGDQCPVKVTIEPMRGQALLRLKQSNIPTDDKNKCQLHMGCSQGWSFWMVNLKAWLEHDVLLHERKVISGLEQFELMEIINR